MQLKVSRQSLLGNPMMYSLLTGIRQPVSTSVQSDIMFSKCFNAIFKKKRMWVEGRVRRAPILQIRGIYTKMSRCLSCPPIFHHSMFLVRTRKIGMKRSKKYYLHSFAFPRFLIEKFNVLYCRKRIWAQFLVCFYHRFQQYSD